MPNQKSKTAAKSSTQVKKEEPAKKVESKPARRAGKPSNPFLERHPPSKRPAKY